MRPGARVLVTGGSSGLGRFLAERCAAQGCRVFVTLRGGELPPTLAAHDNVRLLRADVRDGQQVAAAVRSMTDTHGVDRLDVLINNAGVAAPGPLETLPIDRVADQFDVNVLGVLRVTQQCLPLIRSAHGKILNIGSMSASMALPFAGAYGASKAALKAVTWAMRLELRPWGIGVFHLEAGNFDTPIWQKALAQGAATDSELYRPFIATVLEVMKRRSRAANEPERLWRAVDDICEGRRHAFNTTVGRDASVRSVMTRLLPDSVLERMIARTLKL